MKKQLTPIREFGGYSISKTATRVKFGCGAVNVSKKDLLVVADILEKLELENKKIEALQKKITSIRNSKTLLKSSKVYDNSMVRLVRAWRKNMYVNPSDVEAIGAETLRRIAL